MKNLFLFLVALTSAFTGIAQNKITQTREASNFTFVKLKIPATVYVTQENRFSVQVSASGEMLENISTEVEDNTLEIINAASDSKSKSDWWKDKSDVIIYISMPKPNGLVVLGSGTIKAQNNFTTDYLNAEVHGSGIIELKDFKTEKSEIDVEGSGIIKMQTGFSQGMVLEVQGSGIIQATSLMTNVMSLSLAGSGNLKIDQVQSEKLEATVGGSGSISISKGTASNILLENRGSGEISAGDLVGETVSAKVTGSGDISISVVTALDASVTGSGSVRYKGNPANLSKNINGSGSVNRF